MSSNSGRKPADVGMQHEAGARHAVGTGVDGRDLEPVDDERTRLDGDVVDRILRAVLPCGRT